MTQKLQFIERVELAIRRQGLLREGDSVLLAVSGGADSMVMLYVLAQLARAHSWKLAVAHFNHGLRGRASDRDEALVKRIAAKLGLRFVSESGGVAALAKGSGVSIEMAARDLRHAFLARAAKELGCSRIAVAHHADDRVELFFIRMFRGAGGGGLSGMKWKGVSPVSREIQIIRPLLGERRDDIREFAKTNGVAFREDKSNQNSDILRNRIRRELLPLLQESYQPAIATIILRQMEILEAEAEFAVTCALDWLDGSSGSAFDDLPLAVQRRVLLIQLQRLDVAGDFQWVEELRERADVPVQTGPGKRLVRGGDGLIFVLNEDTPKSGEPGVRADLSRNRGAIQLNGLKIRWNKGLCAGGTNRAYKKQVNLERFDAQCVGTRVLLRHWQPGDRFQPIGMRQPVKLQDFFTNQKVPKNARHELWLAEAESGEIFWVEGMRIGERFKLRETSNYELKWTWKRI